MFKCNVTNSYFSVNIKVQGWLKSSEPQIERLDLTALELHIFNIAPFHIHTFAKMSEGFSPLFVEVLPLAVKKVLHSCYDVIVPVENGSNENFFHV